jgi:hypothetical protein
MKAIEGADERNQKKLNGIIADLLVDFTSVAMFIRPSTRRSLTTERCFLLKKARGEGA